VYLHIPEHCSPECGQEIRAFNHEVTSDIKVPMLCLKSDVSTMASSLWL
jgi:hypothetical protein